MALEWRRGAYTITTDLDRVDIDLVHAFLDKRSYWARGVPREVVEASVRNSVCFVLLHEGAQVGFARAITDRSTFAYMADVFVLEEHRGQKLGEWLVATMLSHPDLRDIPRWRLATLDAHGLYAKYGFGPLAYPERMMERIAQDSWATPRKELER
jgi:GNAT superfamily N-acetyltransferase